MSHSARSGFGLVILSISMSTLLLTLLFTLLFTLLASPIASIGLEQRPERVDIVNWMADREMKSSVLDQDRSRASTKKGEA